MNREELNKHHQKEGNPHRYSQLHKDLNHEFHEFSLIKIITLLSYSFQLVKLVSNVFLPAGKRNLRDISSAKHFITNHNFYNLKKII